MKKAQIIYISNDRYKNYSNKFIETVGEFLPDYEKLVTIITDDISYFDFIDQFESEFLKFEFKEMPSDIPYPCVNLSKFAYVKHYLNNEYEYSFYFDSDTYFVGLPKYKNDFIINKIESGEITMAYNTSTASAFVKEVYDSEENRLWNLELTRNLTDERPSSKLYETLGIKDPSYIWVTSSMFFGSYNSMFNFCEIANDRTKKEMCGEYLDAIPEYHVPRLFDETVANRLICETKVGIEERIKFNVGFFVASDEYYIGTLPNILFIQKYKTKEWHKNHK